LENVDDTVSLKHGTDRSYPAMLLARTSFSEISRMTCPYVSLKKSVLGMSMSTPVDNRPNLIIIIIIIITLFFNIYAHRLCAGGH